MYFMSGGCKCCKEIRNNIHVGKQLSCRQITLMSANNFHVTKWLIVFAPSAAPILYKYKAEKTEIKFSFYSKTLRKLKFEKSTLVRKKKSDLCNTCSFMMRFLTRTRSCNETYHVFIMFGLKV